MALKLLGFERSGWTKEKIEWEIEYLVRINAKIQECLSGERLFSVQGMLYTDADDLYEAVGITDVYCYHAANLAFKSIKPAMHMCMTVYDQLNFIFATRMDRLVVFDYMDSMWTDMRMVGRTSQ